MDKQKQIEEMVLAVYPWLKEVPIEERKQLSENVSGSMVMERLYNAGYRKIPENAVVLTREENEKWLDFLELNMSKTRQRTVKEVLQKVKSYTLDKEVGMKYLLKRLGQEYGVEIE